jgi:hypothetical protein
MKRFVVDFGAEEEMPLPPEPEIPQFVAKRGYRRYSTVAFTFTNMVEFLRIGGVGRMRPQPFRGYQTVPSVKRGRNDRLVRFTNLDTNPWRVNVDYRLFDNVIATLDYIEPIYYLTLKDAGWQTKTTKDRLDTLLDSAGINYRILQDRFKWYLAPTGRYDQPDVDRWDKKNWMPWVGRATFAIPPNEPGELV